MRSTLPRLALAFALAAPATPALADDEYGAITATVDFMMGSAPVGDRHGFVAPGGHLDVGFGVRRWRLAAELDTGLWTEPTEGADDAVMSRSGSFRRYGMALRFRLKERELGGSGRPRAALGMYVEAGLGRQRVALPEPEAAVVTRGDLVLGLGTELVIGTRKRFGANFGVRTVIAREPEPGAAALGACAACGRRGHDVAFLYVFGFRFGR